MTASMIETIKELNNARFGSFGEFLFESHYVNANIKRKHSESTDFILNGEAIDVKATRKFDLAATYRKYIGKRVEGVSYAYIQFCKSEVVCYIESKKAFTKTYEEIEPIFADWKMHRKSVTSNAHKVSPIYKANLKAIKDIVTIFYAKQGIKCRIIYRTISQAFGSESPHNLLPATVKEGRATVFIDFNDYKLAEDNIVRIVAFKDTDSVDFPMLDKARLHLQKVDLDALSDDYKFDSLQSLVGHRLTPNNL